LSLIRYGTSKSGSYPGRGDNAPTTLKMSGGVNCPSAQPDQMGAVVIGVSVSTACTQPRVRLLPAAAPLEAISHLIPPHVPITEVVRLAAPCAEQRCSHFRDQKCTLAQRIVARLEPVADRLSPCAIRPTCRWWRQHGPAACIRCPQIVTEPFRPSDQLVEVATPPVPLANQPPTKEEEELTWLPK
jgi:hypothetical protein